MTKHSLLPVLLALSACELHDPSQEGLLVPLTVAEDPALPSLQLSDGTLLHVETFGDPSAPVLIVLHGGPGGDYRSYLSLSALADSFFVVFWDQRGTGLSQRVPLEQLDGPQYLRDLDELGARFSPERPFILLGHSWGGAFATYYVQNHPERVSKLLLVEPGALTPEAASVAYSGAVQITDADLNRFVQASDYVFPDSFAEQDYFFTILNANAGKEDFAPGEDPDEVSFWRSGFFANLGINTWQGNFDTPTFDATIGLEAFDGPTLLLAGTHSPRLGYDFQLQHHAPFFQDLTLIALEGDGHFILQFDAERSLPLLRAFLEAP